MEFIAGCFEQDELYSKEERSVYKSKDKSHTVGTQQCSNYKHQSNLFAYFFSCFTVMMLDCAVTKNLPPFKKGKNNTITFSPERKAINKSSLLCNSLRMLCVWAAGADHWMVLPRHVLYLHLTILFSLSNALYIEKIFLFSSLPDFIITGWLGNIAVFIV